MRQAVEEAGAEKEGENKEGWGEGAFEFQGRSRKRQVAGGKEKPLIFTNFR